MMDVTDKADDVVYAPSDISDLRGFASEISVAGKDTTLYDSLKGMKFTDSDGRTSVIESVDSLASYLMTLGYHLDSDGTHYSLIPYTEEYDDDDLDKPGFSLSYFEICSSAADVKSYMIDSIKASTFSSCGFARATMIVSDTTIDDIRDMARGVSDDTLLSDVFMGTRYDFTSHDAVRGTASAAQFLAVSTPDSNIITRSNDLYSVLMTMGSDLGYANIVFVSSPDLIREDGNIYTVGQLMSAIDNQFYCPVMTVI